MPNRSLWILPIMLLMFTTSTHEHIWRITNTTCKTHDEQLLQVNSCEIRSGNQESTILHFDIELQQPVDDILVSISMQRPQGNIFRSFTMNGTYDFCQIMRAGKSKPAVRQFYHLLKKYTTLNHTCPLQGNLFGNIVIMKEDVKLLLPQGYYLITSIWQASKKSLFSILVWASHTPE